MDEMTDQSRTDPGWTEDDRLAALARYGILDTEQEKSFDDITQLAADIFDAPIAVINFVAGDRQWFKAEIGIGQRELPLDVSICRHAILQSGLFVVPDLRADPRFSGNPLVDLAGGLRFYAGALLEADGLPIGTLCVLDTEPRSGGATERQARALQILASQVMTQLELRRSSVTARLQADELQHITDSIPVLVAYFDADQRYRFANAAYESWFGRRPGEIIGMPIADLLGAELYAQRRDRIEAALAGNEQRFEERVSTPDGRQRLTETVYIPRHGADSRIVGAFGLVTDLTSRDAAMTALRESEARFRLLADSSPALIWVCDADADVVFVNQRYQEVFGEPAERMHGAGWRRIVHPDDLNGFEARFMEAFRTRERFVDEVRVRQSSGETVWLRCEAVPRYEADGGFAGYVGVNLDVTEAREAALAVRKQATELAAIYDAAPIGLCVLDRELRYVRINDRLAEINGIPAADHIGRTVREIVPDLDEQIAAVFSRVLGGEAVLGIELTGSTPAQPGAVRTWRENWVPLRGSDGEVTGVAISAEEVTEERAAAEALKASESRLRELNETLESRVAERTSELSESQRRFRGIFDSAFQSMALLAPDGTVLEVNQTALEWSQIGPEDIIGIPFWLAAPMRGNPALQAAIRDGVRRAAGGETVRAEYEMRGAGEARATVDFSLKPVQGDGGGPIWLVAEGRDISEFKATQEALRQSQKLESMGQLTGGVAHDFNNLLTPIIGSLDLLQRRGLGGEREHRLIDGAIQSAERAKTLVQRLLAFARRQPLQAVPLDLEPLVTGMMDLIASTSGPEVRVAADLAPDLPRVKGDPNQIEMAILNLAVNARDAMPQGGRLTIAARPVVVGTDGSAPVPVGGYVCLSVSDTGVGMDEETLAKAVEPFFSTKGVGKGTGLGLSMVHGLALQLGGALAIHSRPGLGTSVELWLPVTQEEGGALAAEEEDGRGRSCGTVLLVDDEDLVRMATADMLADLGYTVVEASSGEDAMRKIAAGLDFQLLVTDHLMPGMRGTELAREVRDRRPGTPAFLISGYADFEGVPPDLPRITKPFRRSDLEAMLTSAVAKAEGDMDGSS